MHIGREGLKNQSPNDTSNGWSIYNSLISNEKYKSLLKCPTIEFDYMYVKEFKEFLILIVNDLLKVWVFIQNNILVYHRYYFNFFLFS